MAVGRIGPQRAVRRRMRRPNKKHVAEENVSRSPSFSTLKSGRRSREEKIKINRNALSVLRPNGNLDGIG
ncbi:hypothetical protein V1478_018928 [Vespula squamosa]|uniref:Uncharacterized protein n=1 Tax=Vespula squamosa TaxID=30214 RepID=A0ABD1ZT47_VESSQ